MRIAVRRVEGSVGFKDRGACALPSRIQSSALSRASPPRSPAADFPTSERSASTPPLHPLLASAPAPSAPRCFHPARCSLDEQRRLSKDTSVPAWLQLGRSGGGAAASPRRRPASGAAQRGSRGSSSCEAPGANRRCAFKETDSGRAGAGSGGGFSRRRRALATEMNGAVQEGCVEEGAGAEGERRLRATSRRYCCTVSQDFHKRFICATTRRTLQKSILWPKHPEKGLAWDSKLTRS